jgi:hypothetical protein
MITQQEFIATVEPLINNGELFVHFDDTSNTILGIAIANITSEPRNISKLLEQLQQISFMLNKGGNFQQVTLRITDKIFKSTFTYCKSETFNVSPVLALADNDTMISNLQLTPSVLDIEIAKSDYNALQNSVQNQVKSTYLQISERDKLSNLPTNIDALLAGTGILAQIPDSNYTTSGWIRSRYEGSSVSISDYNGVPGSLAGSTFLGSLHPPTTATGSICALASFDRVIETFIHTGNRDYPTFETGPRFRLLVGSTQALDARETVLRGNLANTTVPLAKYDLLLISSSIAEEIVRVLDYNEIGQEIYIERGVADTAPTNFTANSFQIFPIKSTQVFRIEGNRATALTDSWIWIKDPLTLVKTDKYGIVYREVTCPEIIYFRPQG